MRKPPSNYTFLDIPKMAKTCSSSGAYNDFIVHNNNFHCSSLKNLFNRS